MADVATLRAGTRRGSSGWEEELPARGIRLRLGRLVVALGMVAALTGCQSSSETTRPTTATVTATTRAPAVAGAVARYHGIQPEPLAPRPSFVLTNTDGRRFNFAAETGGRPTLLYFGYTNCPDECPTTMGDIGEALRSAKPAVASKVRVVFVTTDPGRDTGPVLRRWLDHFDTGLAVPFIGLRGSATEIAAAERMAGVPPSESVAQQGGGYTVNHASMLYGYAVDDLGHVVYPDGTPPATFAADFGELLKPEQPT